MNVYFLLPNGILRLALESSRITYVVVAGGCTYVRTYVRPSLDHWMDGGPNEENKNPSDTWVERLRVVRD
jgi:hypothetical protein